jgi:D-alanyl-D-alanine carboxypeptidase
VLGASSGTMRAVRAAQLLDRGFSGNTLAWLKPSLGTVNNLVPIDASPPNLRDEMCGGKRHHKPASDEDEDSIASNATGSSGSGETGATFFAAGLQPPLTKPSDLMAAAPAPSEPISVYTGPTRTGTAVIAAVAADADAQTQAKPHRGKKSRLAARKPGDAAAPKADASARNEAKGDAKPAAKHASAKPDATAKPVAAADPSATKPARPKTAAKPSAKPAPKSNSGDAKPAT